LISTSLSRITRKKAQQRHQRPAVVATLQLQDGGEAAVGDERKRMRRVDRQRRQDREHLIDEVGVEPAPLDLREFVRIQHGNTGLAQIVLERRPDILLMAHQGRGAVADRHELFGRRHAVVAEQGRAGLQHVDEPGDTDHVEFVEVRRGYRQEPHPLQQWMALVGRLLQHPRVEGQPRQFTIDEASGTVGWYFERSRIGRVERVHVDPCGALSLKLCTGTVASPHDPVMAFN
jgi:hypothetical protein